MHLILRLESSWRFNLNNKEPICIFPSSPTSKSKLQLVQGSHAVPSIPSKLTTINRLSQRDIWSTHHVLINTNVHVLRCPWIGTRRARTHLESPSQLYATPLLCLCWIIDTEVQFFWTQVRYIPWPSPGSGLHLYPCCPVWPIKCRQGSKTDKSNCQFWENPRYDCLLDHFS